jgi:hypothetical protein
MTYQPGDRLVSRTADWAALGTIHVDSPNDSTLSFTLIRTTEPWSANAVPEPDVADVIVRPRPGTAAYGVYRQVGSAAAELLLGGRQMELNEVIATISQKLSNVPRETITDFVRCHVASGGLLAAVRGKRQPKTILSLSESGVEAERSRQFAASFASELVSQSERIRNLIQHRLTTGTYREGLLRSLLQKYLPRRYHVASGFIFGSGRQLDIIIYDQIEYAPVFREDDLVVVTPDSVRAVIEVKTVLTNAILTEALDILHEAAPSNYGGPPIFKGIFAFERPNQSSFISTIREFYDPDDPDLDLASRAIDDFYAPINALCVLNQSLVLLNFERRRVGKSDILAPAAFEVSNTVGRTAEAAHFCDLLGRFLRHPFEGPRAALSITDFLAHELAISDPHWLYDDLSGPYQFPDDFPEQIAQLIQVAAAYEDWLGGAAWREHGETAKE